MASPEITAIVVDAIVAAFGGDPALFAAWLKKARLETDLATIMSGQRKARSTQAVAAASAESTWAVLEAQRVAKVAEIDALK